MGRNFESPFIPSDAGSRLGLPFLSNSFMFAHSFPGEPSGTSARVSRRAPPKPPKGDLSIGARFAVSQANWPLFALASARFHFTFSDSLPGDHLSHSPSETGAPRERFLVVSTTSFNA